MGMKRPAPEPAGQPVVADGPVQKPGILPAAEEVAAHYIQGEVHRSEQPRHAERIRRIYVHPLLVVMEM